MPGEPTVSHGHGPGPCAGSHIASDVPDGTDTRGWDAHTRGMREHPRLRGVKKATVGRAGADQDSRKGATEENRPGPARSRHPGLDENGLPNDAVAIAQDREGANADKSQS